jgi:hypothetical protein
MAQEITKAPNIKTPQSCLYLISGSIFWGTIFTPFIFIFFDIGPGNYNISNAILSIAIFLLVSFGTYFLFGIYRSKENYFNRRYRNLFLYPAVTPLFLVLGYVVSRLRHV